MGLLEAHQKLEELVQQESTRTVKAILDQDRDGWVVAIAKLVTQPNQRILAMNWLAISLWMNKVYGMQCNRAERLLNKRDHLHGNLSSRNPRTTRLVAHWQGGLMGLLRSAAVWLRQRLHDDFLAASLFASPPTAQDILTAYRKHATYSFVWASFSVLRAFLCLFLFLAGISFFLVPPKALKSWYAARNPAAAKSRARLAKRAMPLLLGLLSLLFADALWSNWQAFGMRQVGRQAEELLINGHQGAIDRFGNGKDELNKALGNLLPMELLLAVAGPEKSQLIEDMVTRLQQLSDDPKNSGFWDLLRDPKIIQHWREQLMVPMRDMKGQALGEFSRRLDRYLGGFAQNDLKDRVRKLRESLDREERARYGGTFVLLMLTFLTAAGGAYSWHARRSRLALCCCFLFTFFVGGLYLGHAYHLALGTAAGAVCDSLQSPPNVSDLSLPSQLRRVLQQCAVTDDLPAAIYASGLKTLQLKGTTVTVQEGSLLVTTRENERLELSFDDKGKPDYKQLIKSFLEEHTRDLLTKLHSALDEMLTHIRSVNDKLSTFRKTIPWLSTILPKRLQADLDYAGNSIDGAIQVLEDAKQNIGVTTDRLRSVLLKRLSGPMEAWLKDALQCPLQAKDVERVVKAGCQASGGLQSLFLDLTLLAGVTVLLTMCLYQLSQYTMQ